MAKCRYIVRLVEDNKIVNVFNSYKAAFNLFSIKKYHNKFTNIKRKKQFHRVWNLKYIIEKVKSKDYFLRF